MSATEITSGYAMFAAAVEGLPMGAYDRAKVEAAHSDEYLHLAWLASMLRRSFEAGVAAGRTERVDEQPAIQAARAEADRYGQALDAVVAAATAADQANDDETADQRFALGLLLGRISHATSAVLAERAEGGAR